MKKEAWCNDCKKLVAQTPVEELIQKKIIEKVDDYHGQCAQCGVPENYSSFNAGPIDVEDAFENYFIEDLRLAFENADLKNKGVLLESCYQILTTEEGGEK